MAVTFLAVACGEAKRSIPPDTTTNLESADATSPQIGPGEAYLPVPGGRIWYKKTGAGTGTPVILLHGGPGYNSFYLISWVVAGQGR